MGNKTYVSLLIGSLLFSLPMKASMIGFYGKGQVLYASQNALREMPSSLGQIGALGTLSYQITPTSEMEASFMAFKKQPLLNKTVAVMRKSLVPMAYNLNAYYKYGLAYKLFEPQWLPGVGAGITYHMTPYSLVDINWTRYYFNNAQKIFESIDSIRIGVGFYLA